MQYRRALTKSQVLAPRPSSQRVQSRDALRAVKSIRDHDRMELLKVRIYVPVATTSSVSGS